MVTSGPTMPRTSQQANEIAVKRHGIQNSWVTQQLIAIYVRSNDWSCENCSKTGITVKITSQGHVRTSDCMCAILKRKKDQLVTAKGASGIPARYSEAKVADWTNTGSNPKELSLNAASFHTVEVYARDIKRMFEKGYGIYLTGPNGVGKTFLACAIGNRAIGCGLTVKFFTMAAIIQTEIRGWKDEDASLIMNSVKKSDVLIIDDIDKIYRTKTGIETSLFDNLLRDRLQSNKPCIFTSNRTISDCANDLGNHIMSMLMEHCAEVVFVGTDHRRNLSNQIRKDILNGG